MSVFWLVLLEKKTVSFFIIAPFDRAHTIFPNTEGCDCAQPNIAVHFQDKYSCFLHISGGNGEATQSISRSSQSVYSHIKAPAFSFCLFHTSTLSQTAQILLISESHFKHLAFCRLLCFVPLVQSAALKVENKAFKAGKSPPCTHETQTGCFLFVFLSIDICAETTCFFWDKCFPQIISHPFNL